MSTPNKNCCPKCGAKEVDFDHPRTKCECGSTDMKPLNLRVTLTMTDLDKVMAVPITRVTNPLDLVNMHKQSSRYLGDIGKCERGAKDAE